MVVDRNDAADFLVAHGREVGTPSAVVEAVISQLRPSIRLVPDVESVAGGRSRIGGTPDVTEGFEWPRSRRGLPLAFVMQIDLTDVQPLDLHSELPPLGLVQVFFEWDRSVAPGDEEWLLLLHDDPAALDGWAEFPADLAEETRFESFPLRPVLEWTIPSPDEVEGAAAEDFLEFWDEARELLEERHGLGPHWTPKHRMLGWANFVQSPGMERESRLLLQVDSDPPDTFDWPACTGMMWGDCGMIYWIDDAATLESGDFSSTRPFWECC